MLLQIFFFNKVEWWKALQGRVSLTQRFWLDSSKYIWYIRVSVGWPAVPLTRWVARWTFHLLQRPWSWHSPPTDWHDRPRLLRNALPIFFYWPPTPHPPPVGSLWSAVAAVTPRPHAASLFYSSTALAAPAAGLTLTVIRTWQVWRAALHCWTHREHIPHTVTVNRRRVPHGEFVKDSPARRQSSRAASAAQGRRSGCRPSAKLVFITTGAKVWWGGRGGGLASGLLRVIWIQAPAVLFYTCFTFLFERGGVKLEVPSSRTTSSSFPNPKKACFFFPVDECSKWHNVFSLPTPPCISLCLH